MRLRFSRSGFTLIEILATITIATLLITPILGMMSLGSKAVYKGSDKTYAVLAAADLIEAVRGIEAALLPPKGDVPYSVDEIRDILRQSDNGRRNLQFNNSYSEKFSIGAFIHETPDQGDLDDSFSGEQKMLRMVTVIVKWKNVMEEEESIRLTSFIGGDAGA
jgi:prepilin-type N-terminal cleavage/methylation domain-containing protein